MSVIIANWFGYRVARCCKNVTDQIYYRPSAFRYCVRRPPARAPNAFVWGATLYFRSKKFVFAERFNGKATRRTLNPRLTRHAIAARIEQKWRTFASSETRAIAKTRQRVNPHPEQHRRHQVGGNACKMGSSCILVHCGLVVSCYFSSSPPALPTVFRKWSVFELIEDENGWTVQVVWDSSILRDSDNTDTVWKFADLTPRLGSRDGSSGNVQRSCRDVGYHRACGGDGKGAP
jgi:hypothetical protein